MVEGLIGAEERVGKQSKWLGICGGMKTMILNRASQETAYSAITGGGWRMSRDDTPTANKGFAFTDCSKNKSDIWYTPLHIIEALGAFDLDPCGNAEHQTATTIYERDGLDQHWLGRVWLNPPYSQVEKWLDRLAEHGKGMALVFARTDTKWAQKHMANADSVFFLKGRIKFLNTDFQCSPYGAGHGSMFLAYGETPEWPFKGWKAK
jgi:phage N-6-adenine-methyltransferase